MFGDSGSIFKGKIQKRVIMGLKYSAILEIFITKGQKWNKSYLMTLKLKVGKILEDDNIILIYNCECKFLLKIIIKLCLLILGDIRRNIWYVISNAS